MEPAQPARSDIVRIAQDAVSTGKVQMIRLNDAWPLALAIEQIIRESMGLAAETAFRAAIDGLRLSCTACGEFNEEAKQAVLLGGKGGFVDQAKEVAFSGPKVAILAQGRCPGCQGSIALAIFRPPEMPAHAKETRKSWWKFW